MLGDLSLLRQAVDKTWCVKNTEAPDMPVDMYISTVGEIAHRDDVYY